MFILFYVYLVFLTSSPSSSSSFIPILIRFLLKTMLGVFDLSLHIISTLQRASPILPVCPLILRVFVTFLKTSKLDRFGFISYYESM